MIKPCDFREKVPSVKAIKHLQKTLTMQDLASNLSNFSWQAVMGVAD
jgi:hypothetical protein